MNRPEWGAMHFDRAVDDGAIMFWGARGVLRRGQLELYRDRQSFVADDTTDKQNFIEFLNEELIPCIEGAIKAYETKDQYAESLDGCYRAAWDDRNSGGYLYIGAWYVHCDRED